jgi:hypothetical protein
VLLRRGLPSGPGEDPWPWSVTFFCKVQRTG